MHFIFLSPSRQIIIRKYFISWGAQQYKHVLFYFKMEQGLDDGTVWSPYTHLQMCTEVCRSVYADQSGLRSHLCKSVFFGFFFLITLNKFRIVDCMCQSPQDVFLMKGFTLWIPSHILVLHHQDKTKCNATESLVKRVIGAKSLFFFIPYADVCVLVLRIRSH